MISTITDSSVTEDTTLPTESTGKTTGTVTEIGTVTEPIHIDTTPGGAPRISNTTEQPETTTNKILTVTEGKTETTTIASGSQTARKSCKTRKDCATDEFCVKKHCERLCETNGNVTKTSVDCVKGTSANNYQLIMLSHLSLNPCI